LSHLVQSRGRGNHGLIYYEILKGDTLSGIAKKCYGDAMAYPRLLEANREGIKNPDLIYPGQKIRIPMD
jgi:nucleoid-associated protein YgaU